MFDILEADIVIMQETKIQRKDLRDDMVLVPGWDVYFSLPKHKKGRPRQTFPFHAWPATVLTVSLRILWRRYLHKELKMRTDPRRGRRHGHPVSPQFIHQVSRAPRGPANRRVPTARPALK